MAAINLEVSLVPELDFQAWDLSDQNENKALIEFCLIFGAFSTMWNSPELCYKTSDLSQQNENNAWIKVSLFGAFCTTGWSQKIRTLKNGHKTVKKQDRHSIFSIT